MLRFLLAAATAAVLAGPNVQAKAAEWIHSIQTGVWNRAELTAHANARLTPQLVKDLQQTFKPLGPLRSLTYQAALAVPGRIVYSFSAVFGAHPLAEEFALDGQGKLAFLLLEPSPPHLAPTSLRAAAEKQVQRQTAAGRFSGAVLIARNGQPVFAEASGLADRARKIPNTLDTRFRIGSMNKMFTAVAALQLAQRGKLRLSDPFGKYLTGYPNKSLASSVTIAELLTHTGGTGDFFGQVYDAHRLQLRTLRDYESLFGKRGLVSAIGKFQYSNYGFILLGLVIGKVSGQSYYDYVREHVYAPAGMTSTGSLPEDVAVARRSVGYMKDSKGHWVSNADTLPYRGTSAGGGYSTVGDMLRFADALQSNKLLNAYYTKLLVTPKVAMGLNGAYAYGFGDTISNGTFCFGHNGGAPGMNGDLEICPSNGYVVVALSNFDPPSAQTMADFITELLPR
jgi:CubicO group peptidase (beta-lactamase class C family)